ncbi:4,5-DOPA dioxygenase extradiol-like protein [Hapsidospora chrysogenum ATCC 11550]|uniref:4,5-DOPA dioxygenase extradiol-like protein n=1 Tax=Hapsidospora chrysogenum (strain ATCC 11550 / CBS 779.69 / DSM 880 / IAM 14645 / JCM 23072 / IMI 49137) TaxID=857340 RepID=A0A086SV04_HAPC1|nr:4,5-DOPA dioxygenase extradiol-like protein [Hapsidospora chrysogenum ATCC 11550]
MGLAPVIALSHGGGPLPLLGDPGHKSIIHSLSHRIPKILSLNDPDKRPRAIILITAHWSTSAPTISGAANPDLIYDYYGFPPETYELKYPAKGDPGIAAEAAAAFRAEGLSDVVVDPRRGWDHGVFVPMTLVRPEADIPIVQMSVLASEDPTSHLRMGRALRALRAKNIAIVGSGFASFHNLRAMMAMRSSGGSRNPEGARIQAISREWNSALTDVVDKNPWQGLEAWRSLPGADLMHPPRGGEHFMPLIACAGAAHKEEKVRWYTDEYLGVDIYTYYWGGSDVE